MNLPDTLLGEAWYWAAWVVWLPVFALCLFRADWARLKDSEQLNVWLGMIVFLVLIWSMKAGVKPGLGFHLLGATVFTLSFGPYLAFIGLSAVLAAVTLNGSAGIFAFGLNELLMAGVAVPCSHFLFKWLSPVLPKHFFVYIFIHGFLCAALTVIATGFTVSVFMAMAGAYEWEYLIGDYFPYFLLLGFSEAWLSGMVMTLFVVYRPNWVLTFNDSCYLCDK
ncbi:energy-coupling factor ABC transporter permease [Dechloromonas denitrificans]|nr:energy-coupling factor ABC transporter permease [Dechloromonas denitrificans]UCV10619.1 energy-coupling factor ABC transporter permease [Dechloromonas denitrificans]